MLFLRAVSHGDVVCPPLLPVLGLCQCPQSWRCFGDGQPNLLLGGLWLQGWMDRQTAAQGISSALGGGGRGTWHHPTHLPAVCSWVGFLSADDQVLVMVAITLPRISMYAYLPPCLHCFNSCVCFSLSPPSLDYRRERKHAAHRALQSSGGGERGGEGIVPRSTPCGDRAWLPPHHSSGVRVAPRVVGLGGGTGLEPLLLPVDGAQMP